MRAALLIVVEEDSNLMIDSPPGNPVLQELAKALRGLEEWQSAPLISCHKSSVWCQQSGDDFTIRATSHKHSHHWGTLLGTSCGCKWSLLQRLLSVCLLPHVQDSLWVQVRSQTLVSATPCLQEYTRNTWNPALASVT